MSRSPHHHDYRGRWRRLIPNLTNGYARRPGKSSHPSSRPRQRVLDRRDAVLRSEPGSVLVLAAIGLAITFGVMGVINMAHGELMMLGAYCTYVDPAAHAAAHRRVGARRDSGRVPGVRRVGVLIERGIVRFLYGRPLETLLATFGVSLILQQVVRDVFSANNGPWRRPSGWRARCRSTKRCRSPTTACTWSCSC